MLKKDKEKLQPVPADLAAVEEIEEEDFENSVHDNAIFKSGKKDKLMVKKVKMPDLPSDTMLDPILEDQRNMTNTTID